MTTPTPADALDVERLSEAAAEFQVLRAEPGRRYTVSNDSHIKDIARKYAALSPQPEVSVTPGLREAAARVLEPLDVDEFVAAIRSEPMDSDLPVEGWDWLSAHNDWHPGCPGGCDITRFLYAYDPDQDRDWLVSGPPHGLPGGTPSPDGLDALFRALAAYHAGDVPASDVIDAADNLKEQLP